MSIDELSKRWENFDTEGLVNAAVSGEGNKETVKEARKLMDETIRARKEK